MDKKKTFIKEVLEPGYKNGKSLWFVFREDRLLVRSIDENQYTIPIVENIKELEITPIRTHYLGRYGDHCCYYAEVSGEKKFPPGMMLFQLWALFDLLDYDLLQIAFFAFHILKWDQTSLYCGRCGSPTKNMEKERAKKCEKCDLISYPRISPAVIVAVIKDNTILLAKNNRFRHREMYSVLAGFVDPGETLEECVKREIKEEADIEVDNIRYFSSQPWPFPDSLMMGFVADYKSGEISVDGDEIVEAEWFTPENLPNIPGKVSIARKLIDWFIEKYSQPDNMKI
jgi:NAD+ diphosphatase